MDLRYRLFWLRQERLTLAVAAACIALVAGALFYLGRQQAKPVEAVVGTVRGFGMRAEETGNYPTIIVESASGLIIQRRASSAMLRACREGDRIKILKQGSLTRLDPSGCKR